MNLISIGYTKKAAGIGGELKVKIEDNYLEDFLKAAVLFLKIKGKDVPFFVENQRVVNDLVVKFEDIDSRSAALPLSGKEILLQEKDLLKEEERELVTEETLEFKKYEGYQIQDSNGKMIGVIEEVVEFPQQEMAILSYEDREIYIPLNKNLIEKIMEEEKIITMELAEGLLDL